MADIAAVYDRELDEHVALLASLKDVLRPHFTMLVRAVATSIRSGGKVMFFGNGGSAADAQHLAAEFVIRYKANRPALAAIALTTDTSILTAGSNDFGFETVFARQIEALGRKGDVAIGISTSGNSPNVLNGLQVAKECGLVTVGFGGGNGGKLAQMADIALTIPSPVTARIQECHILIGHMLCVALEAELELTS